MAALGRFWGQRPEPREGMDDVGDERREMAVLGDPLRHVFDSPKEQELFDPADTILLQ